MSPKRKLPLRKTVRKPARKKTPMCALRGHDPKVLARMAEIVNQDREAYLEKLRSARSYKSQGYAGVVSDRTLVPEKSMIGRCAVCGCEVYFVTYATGRSQGFDGYEYYVRNSHATCFTGQRVCDKCEDKFKRKPKLPLRESKAERALQRFYKKWCADQNRQPNPVPRRVP
jgi:hypothetical protein